MSYKWAWTRSAAVAEDLFSRTGRDPPAGGETGWKDAHDPPLQTMYSVSFHYPVHWVRCHSFLSRALASVLSSLWPR